MKILITLAILLSTAFAFAGEYDDRAAAHWAAQKKIEQQEQLAKAREISAEFRNRVYQFSYRFTQGSPTLARTKAKCVAEPVRCYDSLGCTSWSEDARAVSLDDLDSSSTIYRPSFCELDLPPPTDLACKIGWTWLEKGQGRRYFARCLDKSAVETVFDL